MANEILVYIFDGYADWELAYVCAQLNKADSLQIRTISKDKGPKTSMGGLRVLPDYSLLDYPRDFSGLIIAGRDSWLQGENREILPVLADAMIRGIPVAAICAAVNFLAEQGYLDHLEHTGNSLAYIKEQVPNYKGEKYYRQKQAIRDQAVITANGTATLEFAREILLLFNVGTAEKIDEWYQFHKRGFYH